MLDKAIEANGAYVSVNVSADVYDTTSDGTLIGVNNILVAPNSLDAATVEAVTAAIFDNLEELQAENANARQMSLEASRTMSIPFHAGAQAYFDAN